MRYRDAFLGATDAANYDNEQYGERSWASLLWESEKRYIQSLMSRSDFVPRRHSYLDFACGSGRLLALIASHFEISAGLDISQQMLVRAAQNVPQARLYCRDVTRNTPPLLDAFDLITVFRFVLNCDEEDRAPALTWLAGQLRDETSRLIINNHANLWSHKVAPYLGRRMLGRPRGVTGNVMSGRSFENIARSAGLRVLSRRGLGFLGGNLANILGMTRMRQIQDSFEMLPFIDRFAEDQIYVLARA
jgi:SAM-dependent methyltransferase